MSTLALLSMASGCRRTRRQPSASMVPTIAAGETFSVGSVSPAAVTRGMLVTFRSPANPSVEYVKRVIGVGGDHVEIDEDGNVTLNGTALRRCVLGTWTDASDRLGTPHLAVEQFGSVRYLVLVALDDDPFEHTIPGYCAATSGGCDVPAHAFVALGDNRPNSLDSRQFGFVPESSITGRVLGHDGIDMTRVPSSSRAAIAACPSAR